MIVQSVHLFCSFWYVSEEHKEHDPSVDASATVKRPLPNAQDVTETVSHGLPLELDENVLPAMQSVHLGSAESVAAVRPWPRGHVVMHASAAQSVT